MHDKKQQMKKRKSHLGVVPYREYYDSLHDELERHHCGKALEGMLLLPRSQDDNPAGFPVYLCCFGAMIPSIVRSTKPPKFVIANGFATGQFLGSVTYTSSYGTETTILHNIR